MDLLGDLGSQDQLIAARSENKVLQERVKLLAAQVQTLTLEKAQLEAEVEIYRHESRQGGETTLPDDNNKTDNHHKTDSNHHHSPQDPAVTDAWVKSGNGIFPQHNEVTHSQMHGSHNPLCCALHKNQTLLVTGGADGHVVIAPANVPSTTTSIRVPCHAPVVDVAIYPRYQQHNTLVHVVAGCMDGSVILIRTGNPTSVNRREDRDDEPLFTTTILHKHQKYVRAIDWKVDTLVSCSADGSILLWNVPSRTAETTLTPQLLRSFHYDTAVESICLVPHRNLLLSYARDTPYLMSCHLDKDCELSKIPLNPQNDSFQGHVSFCVMDMCVHGQYLALATDIHRNIVMDLQSHRILRNLYGHQNDGFSQPKIAWSESGQYVLGNTQEDGSICVWDVASSQLVQRLTGHSRPVRDLDVVDDTLVTTSFDKDTRIWYTTTSL